MAFGSWLAGALYDRFGFYAPAFAVGVFFNLANLVVIGFLVARQAWQFRAAGLRLSLRPRLSDSDRLRIIRSRQGRAAITYKLSVHITSLVAPQTKKEC